MGGRPQAQERDGNEQGQHAVACEAPDAERLDPRDLNVDEVEGEREAAERELQNARGRESNLSRALALEEDRWNDLLARAGQAGR